MRRLLPPRARAAPDQGNEDVLRHALVEGDDLVAHLAIGLCVVKYADDRGVAPLENAHNAAQAAPVGVGRLEFHQHLVALHGAVDLVGRNENIVLVFAEPWRALGRTKP